MRPLPQQDWNSMRVTGSSFSTPLLTLAFELHSSEQQKENSEALAKFLELQGKETETSNMSNNTKMRLEVCWNELEALGACFGNNQLFLFGCRDFLRKIILGVAD